MAVTDLTNTKWVLNNVLDVSGGLNYTINFISNNINFTSLSCFPDIRLSLLMYDDVTVGQGLGEFDTGGPNINTWDNEAYKTIEITGGTDATNATLIAWLEDNATQQTEPSSDVIETTISVGTSLLADASVGTTKLLKAFIGNNLIFERLGGNFLTSDGKVLMTSDGKVFNVQEVSTTISFTIDGTTYQADDGMTWGEWVNSSYNTMGFIISDDYVRAPNYDVVGIVICDYSQNTTIPIIANQAYILFSDHACD